LPKAAVAHSRHPSALDGNHDFPMAYKTAPAWHATGNDLSRPTS
jgi:hypothetical protein